MQITINRDGENHGPYALEQVREMLADGSLRETDLAHFEGSEDWMPVTQIPGVKDTGGSPSEEVSSKPATFKCEGCGGELVYSPGVASMECPYCGVTVQCPEPTGEVLEHDFESQLTSLASGAVTTQVLEVDCDACGASNQLDTNQTSGECAFCGTPFVQQPKSANAMKPHAVLPFAVTRDEGIGHFRQWINSRWFAPNKLKELATDVEKFKGLYLPHWTYDTNTITDYTGQRGEYYYVTESYTDNEGKHQTRQVRKTRWYPTWGRVFVNFDDILVPASDTLPRKYVDALEPWDLPQLTPYADQYLSGFQSESYSVNLRAGFEIAKDKMAPDIDTKIRWDIGGDEQRIHTKHTYYNNITFKYILLPVWISAYRFKDKIYQFLVNARTGEVQGERPWSWIKITLLVLFIIALIGTIVHFAE